VLSLASFVLVMLDRLTRCICRNVCAGPWCCLCVALVHCIQPDSELASHTYDVDYVYVSEW